MARLKSNSSEIAFEELKDRINKFVLLPGDTVSDMNLAKEFDMSRTPIREAFQRLIQYNLVEKQRTKFVVKNITETDVKEILDAREAIELQAAKIVVNNDALRALVITKLKIIQNKIEKSIKDKDIKNGFDYDSLFHNTIVATTNNSRLIEIMKNLTIQGERFRWISLLTPQSKEDTIEEHHKIISAFEKKDYELIDKAIHDHLEVAKSNYMKTLANQDWLQILISFKAMFGEK